MSTDLVSAVRQELSLAAHLPVLAPSGPTLEQVERLEAKLLTMPQADIRTVHTFYRGKYERKIIIPPWTVLTGAAHKTAYSVRLEQGVIAVNTDDGIHVLAAPFAMDAPAGIKRVGRVFEQEVVWVDIYDNPDDCHDLAVLEDRLYVVPECGLGENRMALLGRDKAPVLMQLEGE